MTGRKKRILLLDASESVLIRLEQVLEESGFDTTTTWDMREALHLLGTYRYDLIIVGEHPPEVNATEILRQSQYSRNGVPCVVLLPTGGAPGPDYFYSLGASEVVIDWTEAELAERLHQRFAQRAAAAD